MFAWGTRPALTRLFVVLVATAVVVPTTAQAAAPVGVTIAACKRDAITVAGKIALSGSSARKARGAALQVRFQALALFGLPHSGQWRSAGKKTKATAQEDFTGLAADSWVGVMSWRFKKGSRTVLSGLARSEPLRIGSSKGRASCTIAEGLKPPDVTAPTLFVLPTDDLWHRAPATVQVTASDDFSGVKSVRYGVDGGAKAPIGNGGSFAIPGEGAHTVDAEATDVAGNTGTRTAVVRVDAAPPSKPAFSRPFAVTQNPTPTFQWSASTDSGSGMRGYLLTVRKASDNSVVAFQTVGAGTTSLASPATLTDGETYTAVVTAVDNTADKAWTTDSDTLTFRVDKNADASGFSPANGTILSGTAKSTSFTITLDRAADPASVSSTTVVLDRSDGTDPSYSAGCATTPCTSITVDPSNTLGEGHYVLRLNGVKSADEGLTFSGSANYAVPFTESDSIATATASTSLCTLTPGGATSTSPTYPVNAADSNQTAFLDFDLTYSGPSGWTMDALYGGTPIASLSGTAGGHYRLNFPIGGHTSGAPALSFRLTAKCPATTSVSASNLFGSRYP